MIWLRDLKEMPAAEVAGTIERFALSALIT